jgi:adenosylcobinamide-GDP ribazoletransferase
MVLDAWRLAVGTLTVIPVRPPGEVDRPMAARAMVLAPVAAIPFAALVALLGWLGWLSGLPSALVGLVMVATLALATRALHLDGLADTFDGLGATGSPERALAIMKRGDIGPMGAVALIVVVVGQALAFGAVVDGPGGAISAGLVVCCSRAVLPVACRRGVPAARVDGLGVAVLGSVSPVAAWGAWLSAQGVLVVAAALSGRWWLGLVGGVLSITAVLILVDRAVRRLGGSTGDVLGAAVEIALVIMIGCVAA